MLQGTTVHPGVAVGPIRFSGYELEEPRKGRIAAQHVEAEIARFQAAVERSRTQVSELGDRLEGGLGDEERRILGVHGAYLEDPVFLADVEKRIRNDQLPLEGALRRVVQDFDRIFELVEDETLKEKALDLRDVALRVIRNVEEVDDDTEGQDGSEPCILVLRKLSVTDLFRLERDKVLGIVAEEGGAHSHAGILARSLQIPTLTGVSGLRDKLTSGDFVILDSTTGVVHLRPNDVLRREYEVKLVESREAAPFEDTGPLTLADGKEVHLCGTCGNLGEVAQSVDAGLEAIGVYRTELLYLAERSLPTEDLLLHHYTEVLQRAEGRQVVFRLLDLTAEIGIAGLPPRKEPNPALGLRGLRWLFSHPALFREQLRALLRVAPGGLVELVVPFVSNVQDLVRVRSALREERAGLLKAAVPCAGSTRVGAVIEVPAVAFHLAGVAREADFLVVSLDGLMQHLMCADRDNLAVEEYARLYHPSMFRLLAQMARDARGLGKEITLFGEAAHDPLRLPFYLGAGYDRLSVPPVRSGGVRRVLAGWRQVDAEALATRVLAAGTSLACQKVLLEAER
ncbi:MAG: putative PEP-binding protein [Planctomycetota bacterium]